MMKIESLASRPDRAGRYSIRFADGSCLRLYRQTVEDFGLYAGMELTVQQMEQLLSAAGHMSAKMRAVRIVSACNVSKGDLQQRLVQKGENPEDARQAVQWMSDMHLLDDRKTAEQVVRHCIQKGYGANRARQALYEKRIPREFWDEVLEDYPDQTEAIVSFLRSRISDPQNQQEIRRAADALVRRGYSYQDVRRGLQIAEDEFLEE